MLLTNGLAVRLFLSHPVCRTLARAKTTTTTDRFHVWRVRFSQTRLAGGVLMVSVRASARRRARLSVRNSSSFAVVVVVVVVFRRRPETIRTPTQNERAPWNRVSLRFSASRAGPLAPGSGLTAPAQRRYVRRST